MSRTAALGALASAALLASLGGGAVARAQTLHGSIESQINLFPEPRQRELHVVAPWIQWITLRADELAGNRKDDPLLSVHLSGWGGFDLGHALFDGRGAGDLMVAQLRYKDAQTDTEVVLGRQYLLLGLGRAEHLDGLRLQQGLGNGVYAEVFGGAHAGPQLRHEPGDWMAGGRVSYRRGHLLSAGVSFLQARDGEQLARELLGADVVLRPKEWLELGAGALYDTIAMHVAQLDVFGTFYPASGWRVSLDWRRIVPVSFLDKTSIFSVFSDSVRNESGGDISWKVGHRLTLRADAHVLAFDEGQAGYRAGASAILTLGPRDDNTLTLRFGRWKDAVDGYYEGRVATRHYVTRQLYGALDVQVYQYDVGARGNTLSFGTTAAIAYELPRKMRAILAAEGGITPQFETRGQLLARFEWNFFTGF